MIASIGPFWDANETWLFAIGILLIVLHTISCFFILISSCDYVAGVDYKALPLILEQKRPQTIS